MYLFNLCGNFIYNLYKRNYIMKEKSKIRSISLTDSEVEYLKAKYGSGSLTKAIKNMLLILETLSKSNNSSGHAD